MKGIHFKVLSQILPFNILMKIKKNTTDSSKRDEQVVHTAFSTSNVQLCFLQYAKNIIIPLKSQSMLEQRTNHSCRHNL